MRLTKNERALLATLASIANKLISNNSEKLGSKRRKRRSASDVERLRKQIRAARNRKVPVKQIAQKLGITPSYIYQIDK